MATGIDAGHTITRTRRLEGAYSKHELHHELRIVVRETLEHVRADLHELSQTTEEETSIVVVLSDQYRLSELIVERAKELSSFFGEYRKHVRYLHHQHPLSDELPQRCVQVAYKLVLCQLESEPDIEDTVYWAWRGILELPHS